jgi:hypothetical protein
VIQITQRAVYVPPHKVAGGAIKLQSQMKGEEASALTCAGVRILRLGLHQAARCQHARQSAAISKDGGATLPLSNVSVLTRSPAAQQIADEDIHFVADLNAVLSPSVADHSAKCRPTVESAAISYFPYSFRAFAGVSEPKADAEKVF